MQTPLFSIGAVARMLELPAATLRTWEARYGLVVPTRSRGGQRLFSRGQVEELRFVRDEIARGSRPGQAHRLLAERLGDGAGPAALGHRVALAVPGPVAGDLLRQLLERDGFAVVPEDEAPLAVVGVADAEDAARCRRIKEGGGRVIALLDGYGGEPPADAVLQLPVAVDELLDTARSLAAR
ncbi:MAG TPA: MerR family transcriptional regulator [Gaiellaceae bacterium]